MTTGRINQVSASPPTPAKSSTPPSQSSRRNTQGGAPPSQKQWFALSELKSSNPAPPRGGTPQCCLHLLAHQPKHRGFNSTLCPDRCQRPARRLQTPQKRSYPASTSTQAPAACADVALACDTTRPIQLHTRFRGSQRDGLRNVKKI